MEETSDNREKERGNSSVREGTHEDTPRTTQEASSTATAVEGAQKDGHDEAPKRSATSELASMLSHEGTYEDPTQLGLEDDDEPDRPLNWSVIAPAGIAVLAVVCWGLFAPDHFANFATTTLEWIVDKFGWASFCLPPCLSVSRWLSDFPNLDRSNSDETTNNQNFPLPRGLP